MHVAIVQGTRPEIIKNWSIVEGLRAAGVPFDVLHTSQHNTPRMCSDIYDEMRYEPTFVLEGHYRLGRAIEWLQRSLRQRRATHVIVNGGTAASIAGALAAMYLDLDVSHVEAGLRSRDPHMPEERNRIMVDAIAHRLFPYTEIERNLLLASPDVRGEVHLEGNTTVDVLDRFAAEYAERPAGPPFVFATMHRKEFTDSRNRMLAVFGALEALAAEVVRVVFAAHPRTLDMAHKHGIDFADYPHVEIVDALPVFAALAHEKHAEAVVTDSGRIQDEAYVLGVPCVTVRDNTERPLTVVYGANVVTGFNPAAIGRAVVTALAEPRRPWPPIYGTPGVGSRIVGHIVGRPIARRSEIGASAHL